MNRVVTLNPAAARSGRSKTPHASTGEVATRPTSRRDRLRASNTYPNQEDSSPLVPQPVVDTLTLKGRITNHRLLVTRQKQIVDPDSGEIREHLLGGQVTLPCGVILRVARYQDGSTWAWFEQSAPVFLAGMNIHCSTLEETLDAVEQWYVESTAYVDWAVPVEDLRVVRIDLPRDFEGITDFAHLLDGIYRTPVHRVRVNQRYADGSTATVQTLRRGVLRSWLVSGYDKYAEVLSHAGSERHPGRRAALLAAADEIQGRLRVEPSLRRPYLERNGLKTVADLNEPLLSDLSRRMFTKAGFDQSVGGTPHLLAVLRDLSIHDPQAYRRWPSVYATLMCQAYGLPDHCSDKISQRNRALARAWGITAADVLATSAPAVFLDYDLGILREAS